jgi:hypothetical protein
MRRSVQFFATLGLAAVIAGCGGGGIQEGIVNDAELEAQTEAQFKAMMEKQAADMAKGTTPQGNTGAGAGGSGIPMQ